MAIKGARERGSSWLRGKWLRESGRDQKQTAVWGESEHIVCSTDSPGFSETMCSAAAAVSGWVVLRMFSPAFIVFISACRANWTKVKSAWIEISPISRKTYENAILSLSVRSQTYRQLR